MKLAQLFDLLPREEEEVQVSGQVLAIVRDEVTGLYRVHETRNIVTDAGDLHYAQRGAGEAVTNSFDSMELGDSSSSAPGKTSTTSSITLIAGTAKTVKSGYPQTNDGDADNTGSGTDVVTWTFEWAAGDFNSSDITDGIIAVTGHGAGADVLTHFEFTGGSFAKTSSDTLKVIVNHTMNGV